MTTQYEALRDEILAAGCSGGGTLYEFCFYCQGEHFTKKGDNGRLVFGITHNEDCLYSRLENEVHAALETNVS